MFSGKHGLLSSEQNTQKKMMTSQKTGKTTSTTFDVGMMTNWTAKIRGSIMIAHTRCDLNISSLITAYFASISGFLKVSKIGLTC